MRMGFMLEDGRGTGTKASVDVNGFLGVRAISQSIEHSINHFFGLAFNVLFTQTPAGTDDCVFYMENTSDTDISIEGLIISVDGATNVSVYINDKGTRNAATDLVPANLNGGSGNIATGNFEQGSDLAGGSSTLTGGKLVEKFVLRAASDSKTINFEQDIILPKGATLTIYSSAVVEIICTVPFNYHDIE
jgi:hypothetical protein